MFRAHLAALFLTASAFFLGVYASRQWPPPEWLHLDRILALDFELKFILLGTMAVLLLWFFPWFRQFFRRWGHRHEILTMDTANLTLLVLGVVHLGNPRVGSDWRWAVWTVTMISASIGILRGYITLRYFLKRPSPSDGESEEYTPEEIFEEVLGEKAFMPLENLESESLGRDKFIANFGRLVGLPREQSLTFGLNGPWGVGKTTILRQVGEYLRQRGGLVVHFDSWIFRDPDGIIEAYFEQIAGEIQSWAVFPGLQRAFQKLAQGLSVLAERLLPTTVFGIIGEWNPHNIDAVRRELKNSLESLNKRVYILVDDLDRLGEEELHAAFRAIRLISDMPNLTHVLAYDRMSLNESLFPEDETEERARNFLSRIIHFEFTIAPPPEEDRIRLFQEALEPLIRVLDVEESNTFMERLSWNPRGIYLEALQTPREIRRVAAATAWIWAQASQSLDLFDLFVLSIFQYKYPQVYRDLQSHAEWFSQIRWSPSGFGRMERDRWKRESNEYLEALSQDKRPESKIIRKLLSVLLPGVVEEPQTSDPTEKEARKERRFIHPEMYDQYFQFIYNPDILMEKSLQDVARELVEAKDSQARGQLIIDAVTDAVKTGQIESFLDEWGVLTEFIRSAEGTIDSQLIFDIILGLTRASGELATLRPGSFLDQRSQAVFRIIDLIAELPNDDEATRLVLEVIVASPSPGFSGELVFFVKKEESGEEHLFGKRKPRGSAIYPAYDQVVKDYLGKNRLFDNDEDTISILFSTSDKSFVERELMGELTKNPARLAHLLSYVMTLSKRDDGGFRVVHNDFKLLSQHVALKLIDEKTRELPLNRWEYPQERERVRLFRKFMDGREGR